MNKEEMHSNEIQERLESEDWSRNIANRVSIRYEKKQTRNRILFSAVSLIILAIGIGVTFSSPLDLLNPSLTDLDLYNLIFSDELTPIYETVYQEEKISSLFEPISYLIK